MRKMGDYGNTSRLNLISANSVPLLLDPKRMQTTLPRRRPRQLKTRPRPKGRPTRSLESELGLPISLPYPTAPRTKIRRQAKPTLRQNRTTRRSRHRMKLRRRNGHRIFRQAKGSQATCLIFKCQIRREWLARSSPVTVGIRTKVMLSSFTIFRRHLLVQVP